MISEPHIEKIAGLTLVGISQVMTFAENKTHELWQKFMPRINEIANRDGTDLYSVEEFVELFFIDPREDKEFTKWAAVRVKNLRNIPDKMKKLNIPDGLYAVFTYKGKPSEAADSYRYIFNEWLPGSAFSLASRPHFALMGRKYKGEDPDSEEELWIPVSKK